MQTHRAITVAKAAKQLGVGSRRLFQALRAAGVLSEKNIVERRYVDGGYLLNDIRSIYKHGTRIQRWYTVPLVTGKGMALLQEIVDELGTKRSVVVGERCELSHQPRAGRRPEDVRRMGPAGVPAVAPSRLDSRP